MSRADPTGRARSALRSVDRTRAAALVAVAATLGTALQVMYHFIDVVGVPLTFLGVVALSALAATALARAIRPRVAVAVGAVLLAAGLGWYVTRLAGSPPWLALLTDAVDLLNGQSLLRIVNIRAWVLGVAPAPVFLTWYFALRRWYSLAVAVAGVTLGFFVLTGDADLVTTLTGVVAGAAAVGLGDFDRRGEPVAKTETVLVVVAAMIVVPALVPVVPTAAAGDSPAIASEFEGPGSLEANLLHADDDVRVQGDIDLSPQVRFTVESDEPAYWRVASYDRYTGEGWVRTDGSRAYDGGRLSAPEGPTRTVEQRVTLEADSDVLPAAWKPRRVSADADLRVRGDGSVEPADSLSEGDTYAVESSVADPAPADLQSAGTDYPDDVAETYTQLPDSTPARVEARTDRLTADAETPYETARVVEQWLQNNREYSLDVQRPRGDVADAFLFEMDAGYCTYYATTMVTMLRTQDVPARFATGYAPGERVDDDRWVVRGQNAHAWVEVYFPDVGWVEFDPTPSEPREEAREQSVEDAREEEETDVDTNETTGTDEWTPTETPTPEPLTTDDDGSDGRTDGAGEVERTTPRGGVVPLDTDRPDGGTATPDEAGDGDGDDGVLPRAPTRQQFALGAVALAGVVVGVRRSGVGERAYRALWVRYQPRVDPETDVERAFQRLVYHLERERDRPREAGETVRRYLDAVDAGPDARRVAAIRERARYAGSMTEAEADEAVRLVDDLVR